MRFSRHFRITAFATAWALCIAGLLSMPMALGQDKPAGKRFPTNAEEFDRMFDQVKNWGRWGANDELGALNLITEQKRKDAAALVRLGRVVSVSHDVMTEKSIDNETPVEHTMREDFTGDFYRMRNHGTGVTHLDALCHHPHQGKVYNGYDSRDVNTAKGCMKVGLGTMKAGIVTRGVLIDIPRLKNLPYLEPRDPIYVEDIEAWEKMAGVKVSPGDALILRTGRWARRAKLGPWDPTEAGGFAGIHASVVPWLKERGVALLASDAVSDLYPSTVQGVRAPVHDAVLGALGVPLIDNADPEALAETAASLKRWEFLFTVAPLRVLQGTGSLVNPLATF
jgi:kynurenine formamidase